MNTAEACRIAPECWGASQFNAGLEAGEKAANGDTSGVETYIQRQGCWAYSRFNAGFAVALIQARKLDLLKEVFQAAHEEAQRMDMI